MSKYLKVYTLVERWETLKKQDTSTIHILIEAIEKLSQNPNEDNVEEVIELEQTLKNEIADMDDDDREVLEDMILRQLYQSQRQYKENFTRWEFALQRAKDKGIYDTFEILDDIISNSEEEMKEYASSGSSPEKYVDLQQEHLDELDKAWKSADKEIENNPYISEFYKEFFEREYMRKRDVIERHTKYFEDNTFGVWMASLREEKGWSLAKAAEKTGVSSSYIHRIEKGTRGVPSVPKLDQLAKGYDIPTTEMIMMAGTGIKSLEDYILEGAFLINGEQASNSKKANIAEMLRLVLEGPEEEAIEQMRVVRRMVGNNN